MPQKYSLENSPVLVDGDLTIPETAPIQRQDLETAHGVDFDSAELNTPRSAAIRFCGGWWKSIWIGGHFRWTQHPASFRTKFMGEVPRNPSGVRVSHGRAGWAKVLDGRPRRDDARLRALVKEHVDAIAAMPGRH